MKTTVSSKGQIVVPAEFRRQDGIESGQEFEVERQGAGVYLLTAREPAKSQGLVDLLLSCPVKDWYVPVRYVAACAERAAATSFADGGTKGLLPGEYRRAGRGQAFT